MDLVMQTSKQLFMFLQVLSLQNLGYKDLPLPTPTTVDIG